MECEREAAAADLLLRMARDVPGSNLHLPTTYSPFQPPPTQPVPLPALIPPTFRSQLLQLHSGKKRGKNTRKHQVEEEGEEEEEEEAEKEEEVKGGRERK